jgi:hypothetical protein
MNAVAAASSNNNNTNNNNGTNLPATNPLINPGLLYFSQLMSSDLNSIQPVQKNGFNNNKVQTPSVPFQLPQSQQNSYTTTQNVELLNNQAKLLQSSNFLEPLLQCSNYFKFMENYQKYASNILANSQNTINKPTTVTNGFSTLQSQVFNSVSKPATSPITPPTDTPPSSSSFNNGNTTTPSNINRVVSATSLC